jgi:integrase
MSGSGSIEQVQSGRWRVRVRVAGKRKTLLTFDTEAEAQAYLAQAIAAIQSAPDEGVTLWAYGIQVLTQRELSRKIRDPGADWGRWRGHIEHDPIAAIPVRSMRDVHIEDWWERLEAKGLAYQTRQNCLNVLRVIFRQAKKRRVCAHNPCEGLRFDRPAKTEEAWTYLTLEEQGALVHAAKHPIDALITFAIGTGLRAGELVSLRLRDVHIDGADPYVLVRYGGVPAEPTKRGKIRRVPLFGPSLTASAIWLDALPTYAPRNPHGLMFPAPRGGFRSEAHVLRWAEWKAIRARAGITRNLRWHDLRHTCASSLVSGWWGRFWQLAEVRDMLGHAAISTTERYAHLADTALKRAARETSGAAPSAVMALATGERPGEAPSPYSAPVQPGPGDIGGNPVIHSDIDGAALGIRTRDLRFTKPAECIGVSHSSAGNGSLEGQDTRAVVLKALASIHGPVPRLRV